MWDVKLLLTFLRCVRYLKFQSLDKQDNKRTGAFYAPILLIFFETIEELVLKHDFKIAFVSNAFPLKIHFTNVCFFI